MKRDGGGRAAVMLLVGMLVGCGGGEEIEVTDTVNAGGVEIRATHRSSRDSVRIAAMITNRLDTTADLILDADCPLTVIAHREETVLWDELETRACEGLEMPIPLAPGEMRTVAHAIPSSSLAMLENETEYGLAVRVLMSYGTEYLVEAQPSDR